MNAGGTDDQYTAKVSSANYTPTSGAPAFSKSSKSSSHQHDGNDNAPPTAGMFDEIQEILYKQATVPILTNRRPFTQQTLDDG